MSSCGCLLWLVVVPAVCGFPRGAPLSECRTMNPLHGSASEWAGPRASLRVQLLPDGRRAIVTLSGAFRGFLVQARSMNDTSVLVPGRFSPTAGARTLDCGDQDDTAITHVDNVEKRNVTAKWAAPLGWEGSVVFKATVVNKYDAYAEHVLSDDIAIRNADETVAVVRHALRPTAASSSTSAAFATDTGNYKKAVIPEALKFDEASSASTSPFSKASQLSDRGQRLVMSAELQPNGSLGRAPATAPAETPRHADAAGVNRVADDLPRAPARQSSGSDPYEDCGVTKGCFGLVGPCIQTRDCIVLLSFSLAPKGDGFDFEMTGSVAVTNNMWIATGLTDTPSMGMASVVDCFLYDGQPGMQESWNTDAKQNIVQTPTSPGITFGAHGVVNGKLRCAWNRKNLTIAQGKTFDIAKQKYYLLLSSGPFLVDPTTGKPTSKEKLMHTSRGLTATPLLLAKMYEVKVQEEDYVPYKIHGSAEPLEQFCKYAPQLGLDNVGGSLMLVAWLFLVSMAIMMARHFKHNWEGVKIAGLDIWFVFHRSVMTLALLCILASLACVFTAVGGWSFGVNLHPILGIAASALAVCQPIMALFRCHPGEPGRPLFNWLHWANGNVAQSLALATIYFAPGLTKSRLAGSGEFITVLSLLVAFHVAVHMGMQALSMLSATPPAAPLPAAADETKRDSPVPPPGASRGPSTAQPTQDGREEADKEDGASGDAEPASKDAADDDEASDKKSPAAAGGSADAVGDGAAAGTDHGSDPPAQGDAAAAPVPPAAPVPEAAATSALDKIRVVVLAVYILVMLGAVAALVGILWSA